MKKIIKSGLLFIALLFVLSVIGIQVSHAGYCEDICTPQDNKMCIARGTICTDFKAMTIIGPGFPTD